MFILICKIHVTLLFNLYQYRYSTDAILGEGKYRPSLKPNPMACVCIYVYIMYACIFYVYILVMKF